MNPNTLSSQITHIRQDHKHFMFKISQLITEKQITTTKRHHYEPVNITKIKMIYDNKNWWICGIYGILMPQNIKSPQNYDILILSFLHIQRGKKSKLINQWDIYTFRFLEILFTVPEMNMSQKILELLHITVAIIS